MMISIKRLPIIPISFNLSHFSTSTSTLSFKNTLDSGPTLDDFISSSSPSPTSTNTHTHNHRRLPSFLKTPIPTSSSYNKIKNDLRGLGLHTVCEEARCPNIGQCWGGEKGEATATIMLGDTCTRACRFCAVKTSKTPAPLDPNEPENTAEAIRRWGVGYIVLTSVDRDDLPDGGAGHFAETLKRTKEKAPHILLEALTPDFLSSEPLISLVANSGLSVYAHNLETVESLSPNVRDPRADYRQSLRTLRIAKESTKGKRGVGWWGEEGVITKSSLMLGLGETEEEVVQTLKDLRSVSCDVVTFGQYMRPTKRHMKVSSYLTPETYERYGKIAEEMGFLYVASGPLVRSSFKAGELMRSKMGERLLMGLRGGGGGGAQGGGAHGGGVEGRGGGDGDGDGIGVGRVTAEATV